ncbi:hypothetical protein M0R45_010159 [Rubus argutus]|uniref:Uncharacterized protein n=1 Tax=Rubus argutus TaxID=59490 RepID=A0AAW1Y6Z5_RUBAR
MWNDPQEINVSLHLPAKNEYIPRDLSIRSDVLCLDIAANTSHPRCILDEPLMKFWYKLDSTFKLPLDELNGITYDANIAGLGTSLSVYKDKLLLEVYGFNDKLPALCHKFWKQSKVSCQFDRFEVIKEDMERACKKTNMDPWSHAKYLREQVLLQNFYTVDQQLTVLNGLSVSDLKSFIPELFSKLYLVGLFHGNLSEQEATSLAKLFKTNFSAQPLPVELMYKDHCICLPPYANPLIDASVKNKSETNSVTELYFQIEWAVRSDYIRSEVMTDLLMHAIVEEPLFDQLRTRSSSEKAAEELRSIEKEDVINFYRMYFQQSSPECRRLATCVWGCNTDLIREVRPGSVQVIEDLAAFKMSSNFFGRKTCQKVTRLNS